MGLNIDPNDQIWTRDGSFSIHYDGYVGIKMENDGSAILEINQTSTEVFMLVNNPDTGQQVYQYIDAFGYNFYTTGGTGTFKLATDGEYLIFTGGGLIQTATDLEITDTTQGLILHSPDGNKWRIQINNLGIITTTKL